MNKKKLIILGVFILILVNITGIFHDKTLSEEQLKGFVDQHELDPIDVKNGDDRTFILVKEGLYTVAHRTAKYDEEFTPYAWTESDPVMVRTISGDIVAASVVMEEEISKEAKSVTITYSDGTAETVETDQSKGAFLLYDGQNESGGVRVADVIIRDEMENVIYEQNEAPTN
ncbi:hypothetical protein [Jeotgalibacillus salarius]|uniref:Uncharacterized protein n=1 Tax=Jeotgalibacillus salarius TaxID=546023 RepID=A0A4Y8LIL0_9BACL|nr:hypothetical protein [Jeotgalibacillus salarius]TFE02308.1 hypothetical protein E2626_06940 [Jeotgalibacillus salarius]